MCNTGSHYFLTTLSWASCWG